MDTVKHDLPNDINSYLKINKSLKLTSEPPLFTCFDDYYCNSPDSALWGHVLLGVFGLLLTLAGIVLNVILLPVLSLAGIRSSATYYMISMAIPDLCHLIINLLLIVIRYLPSRLESDQLMMYQNFVAYFVPLGFPMRSVCEALSLVSCIFLLIDRFIYVLQESNSNREVKRKIAMKIIVTFVILVIVVKLPNFLLLKIVENSSADSITIRWTSLASSWIFVLDLMLTLLFYLILLICILSVFYIAFRNDRFSKINVKSRFSVLIEERYKRRERLYITLSVAVGILVFLFKLPSIVRLFLYGLNPIKHSQSFRLYLLKSDMSMAFMDIILIVVKPLLYMILVVHFRRALKDMIGLWVRPSLYSELNVAGGIGKRISLVPGASLSRSDTSKTLLKSYSTDNCRDHCTLMSPSKQGIDALAQQHLQKSNSGHEKCDSSSSFVDSSLSFTSSNAVESHNEHCKV